MAAAVMYCALAACTPSGQRPTLSEAGASTTSTSIGASADPGVAALTAVLATAPKATFSATYHVLTKLGSTQSDVKVSHDPDRSVVNASTAAGQPVSIFSGSIEATCSGQPLTCASGVNERPLADAQLTSSFWSASAIRALNVQASRTTEKIASSKRTIAGQSATCVTVIVGVGVNAEFCALSSGVVALWDDQTRRIELTSYTTGVDPANFMPPATITP